MGDVVTTLDFKFDLDLKINDDDEARMKNYEFFFNLPCFLPYPIIYPITGEKTKSASLIDRSGPPAKIQ